MRDARLSPALGAGDIPAGRPLVLLDIDGCLNVERLPENVPPWVGESVPDDVFDDFTEREIVYPRDLVGMHSKLGVPCPERMSVRFSPALADKIGKASDEGLATFVWFTSWMEFSSFFGDVVWRERPVPVEGHLPWLLRGMSDDGRYGKEQAISELFGSPWSLWFRQRLEEDAEFARDALGKEHDEFGRRPGFVTADVPAIVIVDDKGGSYYDEPGIFESAVGGVVPTLAVSPNPVCGITHGEWAMIEAFLRKNF